MSIRRRKRLLYRVIWTGGHYWRECATPGLRVLVSSISTEYMGPHLGAAMAKDET